MPEQYTAVRDLTADEAATPGAIDHAKMMAFTEARDAAITAFGSPDLPQDHSIDDSDEPTVDGGHHIKVTFTLP